MSIGELTIWYSLASIDPASGMFELRQKEERGIQLVPTIVPSLIGIPCWKQPTNLESSIEVSFTFHRTSPSKDEHTLVTRAQTTKAMYRLFMVPIYETPSNNMSSWFT